MRCASADRAGMQVPEQGGGGTESGGATGERLYALCKDAARFYYQTLWQPGIGRRSSISLAAA